MADIVAGNDVFKRDWDIIKDGQWGEKIEINFKMGKCKVRRA